MTDPVRAVALVSGEVQGVGHRWFGRGPATAAGLAGSASNLADGRVEVALEGPEAAVLAAPAGPAAAGAVSAVDVRDDVVRGVRGFTTA